MIEGIDQLNRQLMSLERNASKKIARGAVTRGTRPALQAVKTNAKSMVGGEMGALMAANLKSRTWKKPPKSMYAKAIVFKPDVKEFVHESKAGKRSYIPSAIEHGHGNAAPIPYMRTAFNQTRQTSLQTITNELRSGILKEVKSVGK